jgi:hypothetical protein
MSVQRREAHEDKGCNQRAASQHGKIPNRYDLSAARTQLATQRSVKEFTIHPDGMEPSHKRQDACVSSNPLRLPQGHRHRNDGTGSRQRTGSRSSAKSRPGHCLRAALRVY